MTSSSFQLYIYIFLFLKVVGLMENAEGKIDLSRVILQCIHSGFVREAVHLLPKQPLIQKNNNMYSNAIVYVREMVHARIVRTFNLSYFCSIFFLVYMPH